MASPEGMAASLVVGRKSEERRWREEEGGGNGFRVMGCVGWIIFIL